MAETERQKLREHFLATFVHSMIKASYKEIPKTPEQLAKEHEFQKAVEAVKNNLQKQKREVHEASPVDTSTYLPSQMHHPHSAQPRTLPRPTRQMKKPSVPLPAYQPPKLKPGEKPVSIDLGKLAQILKDPSVFSVEVPGPAKNVKVNRAGQIQTSSLILTKQEIEQIMNEISDKTRIPVMSGLFKAALQDLLITAVISDFVGTRLMIQKRTPFNPVQ